MAKQYITNNHTSALDFPVAGGGFKRVNPNTTENFELANPDSLQIRAWAHVSMITISDKKPESSEKSVEQPSIVIDSPTSGSNSIGAAGGLPVSPTSAPTPAKTSEPSKS